MVVEVLAVGIGNRALLECRLPHGRTPQLDGRGSRDRRRHFHGLQLFGGKLTFWGHRRSCRRFRLPAMLFASLRILFAFVCDVLLRRRPSRRGRSRRHVFCEASRC